MLQNGARQTVGDARFHMSEAIAEYGTAKILPAVEEGDDGCERSVPSYGPPTIAATCSCSGPVVRQDLVASHSHIKLS